jgi:hypothetical protein
MSHCACGWIVPKIVYAMHVGTREQMRDAISILRCPTCARQYAFAAPEVVSALAAACGETGQPEFDPRSAGGIVAGENTSALATRRLRDGARAARLPEPETPEEIRSQLEILSDGIRALQSLDDLGSPEANQRAWDQMVALQAKHARLEEKIRKV